MCDIAYKAEPMTGADDLGAELGETPMRHGAGLKVADVVGRVVHELQVPDATLMRFLQPLELAVDKVEPLHIGNDRGLSRFMGCF